ncbi:MAG TPA: hypothetical protein PK083_06790 [Soehngenia sp.]|nr:hypothetical protein [Soehngenia sp.]
MSTFMAELVGTAILIIFGGGVVAGVSLKHSKATTPPPNLIRIAVPTNSDYIWGRSCSWSFFKTF